MARRRKVIMSRLIDRHADRGEFDAAFWKKVGPKGRMQAMWDMVRTYFTIKGIDEPPRDFRDLLLASNEEKVRWTVTQRNLPSEPKRLVKPSPAARKNGNSIGTGSGV